jgi:hypothetical protein
MRIRRQCFRRHRPDAYDGRGLVRLQSCNRRPRNCETLAARKLGFDHRHRAADFDAMERLRQDRCANHLDAHLRDRKAGARENQCSHERRRERAGENRQSQNDRNDKRRESDDERRLGSQSEIGRDTDSQANRRPKEEALPLSFE